MKRPKYKVDSRYARHYKRRDPETNNPVVVVKLSKAHLHRALAQARRNADKLVILPRVEER